jgi:hypothetical protein
MISRGKLFCPGQINYTVDDPLIVDACQLIAVSSAMPVDLACSVCLLEFIRRTAAIGFNAVAGSMASPRCGTAFHKERM